MPENTSDIQDKGYMKTEENQQLGLSLSPWRLSVAPMLDWTDRHCRYFHRLLSRQTLLYTEMVTTGALIHGDVARHLRFNPEEQPVALQLGGSDPVDLAACAKLGAQWGYSEINLNCGCPSERVQRGAFGACLMAEPQLVADCVKAMVDVVEVPVTVKHRIGIDQVESYDFVCDFVGAVSQAGCATFIVHARNAWLKGLSPKDNRDIPPLRYDWAYRLKRDFPNLTIVLNGGITTTDQLQTHLAQVDGVMLGREAYHNPWWLSEWDSLLASPQAADGLQAANPLTRELVEQQMVDYMAREQATHGTPWPTIARHMLGLRHGLPGARHWRRAWSDHSLKTLPAAQVMAIAHGHQNI
jgi:tRNA-dihydrouridine synthase A